MKLRAIRRDHMLMVIGAVLFAVGLVTTNALWPAAFGLFIAIGGVVGALMVVYEVRLTKRLAQAEFIRDLQTGFSTDPQIGELWRKLLLKERITPADRPLVSSYLTFFETLHLLVDRGALDLGLADDLFRNRFFSAIGNAGILETALAKEAGSFANIHDLIATWHDHLLDNAIPMHPGYYGYVRAITEAKGYEVARLSEQDLTELLALQEGVLQSMSDTPWLRANTDVMLKECLVSHTTLGVRKNGALVAAAALYDGGETEESIKGYFTRDAGLLARSINLKFVFALEEHRSRGLSRALVELLEKQATDLGKSEIMCTIHPGNVPSRSLFGLLGYARLDTVSTSYGKRSVYARELPVPDRRWAR